MNSELRLCGVFSGIIDGFLPTHGLRLGAQAGVYTARSVFSKRIVDSACWDTCNDRGPPEARTVPRFRRMEMGEAAAAAGASIALKRSYLEHAIFFLQSWPVDHR